MVSKEIRFRVIFLLVISLATYLVAGCGLLGGNESELEGTKWTLDTIQGEPLAPQFVVTAEFNDGRISGISACNSYGASYTARNGEMAMEAMAVTEMACVDDGVMELEQVYLQLIGTVKAYQVSEDRLDLLDDNGAVVLSYYKS